MASYKTLFLRSSTIGSPFSGAAPGISVSIGGTTMRGSTDHLGNFNQVIASSLYAPLFKSHQLAPGLLQSSTRTVTFSTITASTTPTVLPYRSRIVEAPVQITNNVFLSATFNDPSANDVLPTVAPFLVKSLNYAPPTISGTTMRQSTTHLGMYNRVNYQTNSIDQGNYILIRANTGVGLNIFGLINHRLYMDY